VIERILLPLDGSELSDRAIPIVSAIAKGERAQVLLVRAVPGEPAHDAEVAAAGQHLEARRKALATAGVETKTRIVRGEAAASVLEAAASFDPSLIVLATHGQTGEKRWIRGSVAERILERSRFPLLLTNPFALAGARKFEKILVPLDGSSDAASVLPLVEDVARLFDAEVTLFHGFEVPEGDAAAEARRLLEHHRRSLSGVKAKIATASGPVAASILDLVEREKVDLLALTTHGRSGTSRWLYGSVADIVLHHAPVCMLVKRTAIG